MSWRIEQALACTVDWQDSSHKQDKLIQFTISDAQVLRKRNKISTWYTSFAWVQVKAFALSWDTLTTPNVGGLNRKTYWITILNWNLKRIPGWASSSVEFGVFDLHTSAYFFLCVNTCAIILALQLMLWTGVCFRLAPSLPGYMCWYFVDAKSHEKVINPSGENSRKEVHDTPRLICPTKGTWTMSKKCWALPSQAATSNTCTLLSVYRAMPVMPKAEKQL